MFYGTNSLPLSQTLFSLNKFIIDDLYVSAVVVEEQGVDDFILVLVKVIIF